MATFEFKGKPTVGDIAALMQSLQPGANPAEMLRYFDSRVKGGLLDRPATEMGDFYLALNAWVQEASQKAAEFNTLLALFQRPTTMGE